MKNRTILLMIAVLGGLCSCSARIEGTLRTEGSAELRVHASLEPRIAAVIASFSGRLGGGDPRDFALDGAAIGRSMETAPGISAVSFYNIDPKTVEGTITISRVDEFLSVPGVDRKFLRYSQGAGGGNLAIRFELDTAPELLLLLSEDVADYLSALMAPAATGEILTREEYLDLVASVYGDGVAAEISGARIALTLDVPGPIRRITGGTYSGRRARFDIPLIEALVLDVPLVYEIEWN
ncbi:hypothetical protein [Breznakiella homolactica]|uniref:DUF4292 domain-containing protein n=1 Tax=Breznakiella homolactica TaxID=2798577 RepID=A0A7T7XR87_9SPIR|nr:hypothetical protein [Breznakiella homolactica]QQO11020.1 hypothetical protein JFL75_08915 [Breznakiella homolactica]